MMREFHSYPHRRQFRGILTILFFVILAGRGSFSFALIIILVYIIKSLKESVTHGIIGRVGDAYSGEVVKGER